MSYNALERKEKEKFREKNRVIKQENFIWRKLNEKYQVYLKKWNKQKQNTRKTWNFLVLSLLLPHQVESHYLYLPHLKHPQKVTTAGITFRLSGQKAIVS